MKRNPKQFGDDENDAAFLCLRAVEERMEMLQGCLHGKETVERPLLLEYIKMVQKQDAEMLAAVDKDIAKLKSQIEDLEFQAAKYRKGIQSQ